MIRKDEQGFALPIVLAVLLILVFSAFFLISQLVRHKQSILLSSEMLEAQYTAESGIALMQQQLKQHPQNTRDIFYRSQNFFITTSATHHPDHILIESKSVGRYGVRQTVRVKVDPKTLVVREWLK